MTNPVISDRIKNGVVQHLPCAEKLDGVAEPQPVEDEIVGITLLLAVRKAFGDVRQRDIMGVFQSFAPLPEDAGVPRQQRALKSEILKCTRYNPLRSG